jgi:uncharacterized SAM-binding protein YcdF (DUF218 family)
MCGIKQWYIVVLAMCFPSCLFLGPSAARLYSRAQERKPYDVVIVPGIPYDSTVGTWSRTMKGRIYWAKHLYETGITKNILFSGSSVYTPYVESEIMALYARQLGIPDTCIFVEKQAEHSTENVYYSYYLARRMGFEKIAVATDPVQSRLLRSYPRMIGLKIDFIPFVLDTLRVMPMQEVGIEAEQTRQSFFEPIQDRESRFRRWMGTLGLNVIRVEEDVRNKRKLRK